MLSDRLGLVCTCAIVAWAASLLVGCEVKARTTSSAAPASASSARTSSDASSRPHASPIATRAQLVAQADAICRKQNTALAAANVAAKSSNEIADAVVGNETIERGARGNSAV